MSGYSECCGVYFDPLPPPQKKRIKRAENPVVVSRSSNWIDDKEEELRRNDGIQIEDQLEDPLLSLNAITRN